MNNKAGRLAFRVTSFYVIMAAVWILVSEEVVKHYAHDANFPLKLSLFKGWGFVLVTGFLLYQATSRECLKRTE